MSSQKEQTHLFFFPSVFANNCKQAHRGSKLCWPIGNLNFERGELDQAQAT